MRSLVVLIAFACACSKPKPDAAVETYANSDMAVSIGYAKQGYAVVGRLKASDANDKTVLTDMIGAATALRTARTQASTITAPPAMASVHAQFLTATSGMKSALDTMIVAAGLGNANDFATGHAALMEAAPAWFAWEEQFAAALEKAHVKLAPPATLPPLPEAPPPPPPKPVAPPPPDCKPGTEEKQGDTLVACELTKETEGAPSCVPGMATFSPQGAIVECTTGMMWALPYETPQPKEQVVLCGPGRYRRGADGATAGCTLGSDVVVGTTTLAKGTFVTIGDKLAVVGAETADGKRQCFDSTGATKECPK